MVTFRLMEALRSVGVDARMLVGKKNTDSPFVEQAAPDWRRKVPFYQEHLDIFLHNGLSKRHLFEVSTAKYGLPLAEHPLIKTADAVFLNWVNQGLLSLSEIGKIAAEKPVVWTMHDLWNATGVCHHCGKCRHYQSHCQECPLLGSAKGPHDLSFDTFNRKKELYGHSGIKFVAVSNWLAAQARSSALMHDQSLNVIPNALDIATLSNPPEQSKSEFGIPEDKKLIMLCAARLDDPIKDFPLAVKALNGLHRDDVAAVLVGNLKNPDILRELELNHIWLGPVYEKKMMQSLLKHADVMLSTSRFESLQTTLIEAQAAGVTPVSQVHDGRGDIITDGLSGYPFNTAQEATAALTKALDTPIPKEQLRQQAERFSYQTIARKYLGLIGVWH